MNTIQPKEQLAVSSIGPELQLAVLTTRTKQRNAVYTIQPKQQLAVLFIRAELQQAVLTTQT
jgi:hypothetical protein